MEIYNSNKSKKSIDFGMPEGESSTAEEAKEEEETAKKEKPTPALLSKKPKQEKQSDM